MLKFVIVILATCCTSSSEIGTLQYWDSGLEWTVDCWKTNQLVCYALMPLTMVHAWVGSTTLCSNNDLLCYVFSSAPKCCLLNYSFLPSIDSMKFIIQHEIHASESEFTLLLHRPFSTTVQQVTCCTEAWVMPQYNPWENVVAVWEWWLIWQY